MSSLSPQGRRDRFVFIPYVQGADIYYVQLKLAIPSASAGAVIGRGGEVIKTIQTQTGAKVQLGHKVSDFAHALANPRFPRLV
jgi:hypothetical protein